MLGPIVGLITAVVALFMSRKNSENAKKVEIRTQIKGQIIPQALNHLRDHLRLIIGKWMDAFEKAMRQDIDEQVQLKLRTLKEAQQKKEAREESSAEDQKRAEDAMQETENQIIRLNQLIY